MKIKKMFSVTLALALLLQIFALALPVSAEAVDETDTSSTGAATNSTDSRYLTSEEKTLLNVSSNDVVVKLFTGAFMDDFSKKEDILNMVEKSGTKYLVEKYYGDGMTQIMYYRKHNGEMVKLDRNAFGQWDWSSFYSYVVSPDKVFDPSVKVNSVYGMDGMYSLDGAYIYYDTDQGDYVLFRQYVTDDVTYLFPISVFYEVAEILYNERLSHGELDMGVNSLLEELYDADRYLFRDGHLFKPKSNAFNWVVMGLIIVPIAAGGVLWFLFHRRKVKGTNG
jgi:hypothetical protein